MAIAQTLYEAKLTTYPRTDARVISTAVAKEIHKNIAGLTTYEHNGSCAAEIMQNQMYRGLEKSSYVDDSKITDHYAIIPTGQINVSELKDIESKCLMLSLIVSYRFLSPGCI